VRNEPRHHNVFENEYVRLLDVWLAPGDTTQFHIHATPSVFNMFTQTTTVSQLIDEQPSKSSTSVAGSTFYDSLVTPRIHRVWNKDTSWYHVMDIELVAGKPHIAEPVLQIAHLQILFDKPLVRGYHLQLPANGNLQLPASKNGYLLLSLGEASVNYKSLGAIENYNLEAGHYHWVSAGQEFSITLSNSTPAAFTLFQLK
ncbi:MAG: hypothetical protein ABI416_06900, partial [Ginsengibacter sp.]